ncbi:MAG: hypothetical protein IJA39_00095 [Clostridia bacterium]|nr:hypothetical protein [Clostridia bacterium]
MKKAFVKKLLSVTLVVIILSALTVTAASANDGGLYVNILDYVNSDGVTDVASDIQAVIDANPNRVIFFPDGEYLVSAPILTPANPSKSVSLKLSDFAVVRASSDFPMGEAVIQLGGKDAFNDTHTPGSNYSLEGGVIDGSGIANGVSINSGRETAVRNTSIKNAVIGLHIMYGANNGSSDSDITGINIIGNGSPESVGILLEGFDNTLTNIRIGNIHTGVHVKSAGNILRNIHPLYYSDFNYYESSCGFLIDTGNNWFDYCYADNFATGYRMTSNDHCTFVNSFCYWYTDRGGIQTVFKFDKQFNSDINGLKAGFNGDAVKNILLVGEIGGTGTIEDIDADTSACESKAYMAYQNDYLGITRIIGFFALIFEFFRNIFVIA